MSPAKQSNSANNSSVGQVSGSDSDSDDQDGFVKVDRWGPQSAEPTQLAFEPTILQMDKSATVTKAVTSIATPAVSAEPGLSSHSINLIDRVKNTIKAAVATVQSPSNSNDDSSGGNSASSSSDSDEDISDVLDETEIQLIEAMEDTQISPAADSKAGSGAGSGGDRTSQTSPWKSSTVSRAMTLLGSPPRKPLGWVGLGEASNTIHASFADSLKERFSATQKLNSTSNSSIRVSSSNELSSDSESDNSSDDNGVDDVTAQTSNSLSIANSAAPELAATPIPAPTQIHNVPLRALPPLLSSKNIEPKLSAASPTPKPNVSAKSAPDAVKETPLASLTCAFEKSVVGGDGAAVKPTVASPSKSPKEDGATEMKEDTGRSASQPLDSVEFVAPGVTKQTAMSLLRRVLDIDRPVIQQKMVEFLLIDGVIASLIGFITHCQGSVYSPTSPTSPTTSQSSQSVPSTPLYYQADNNGIDNPQKNTGSKEMPLGVLQEFELRSQHRARLQRQRNRSAELSETNLRRGYNAFHMLSSRDQCARRVVEAKLGVIVPCVMAVFHKDSLGSFHHACLLLEHCFALSPLKTTRLLLYQQNPPSRWWSQSESVALGRAPICDILPYLSEPCVQRLFSKAEFGVWTGRLMTSLNLSPNDAIVVSDELNRIGLASVASALNTKGTDDSASKEASNVQRLKALQLVRNRFQQLNRGGFFDRILVLIEDPDPQVSESVAEFMAFMINDCSTFYGFNLLFKPIFESEVPVRRLAQLIVNSSSQRLSSQACAATRLLYALLTKTSCQYGLRTREAQGIRDPELHPRGSQVLLQVSTAARSALESFLPGLFATVTGLKGNTDLTSHSTFNRRASVESLRLPEYEETDLDFDTDGTEADDSDPDESDGGISSGIEDDDANSDDDMRRSPTAEHEDELGCSQGLYCGPLSVANAAAVADYTTDDSEANDENEVNDLRNSAAALFQATYPESIGSGSISSSLSPSSTLSASPMAIASSTPERPSEAYSVGRLDTEDLGLMASLPKPDVHRLNLLRICIEVLRECKDVDEIVGWVDLRVWRALSNWFLNHPHNNMLHLSVYQLVSMVSLEAVRLRQAHRRLGIDPRSMDEVPVDFPNKLSAFTAASDEDGDNYDDDGDYSRLLKQRGSACGIVLHAGGSSYNPRHHRQSHADDGDAYPPESRAQMAARRRARRRREMAERIRFDEASNCDNILTYLVEQNQWADKLILRATSPNFDGAQGYISLILNTLRLAVQVDRRRQTPSTAAASGAIGGKDKGDGSIGATDKAGSRRYSTTGMSPAATAAAVAKSFDWLDNELPVDADESMLPDLAYHDPKTRQRLSEYPAYRLQRWEITLLYSPHFHAHLRRLREQALSMTHKSDEFRLCDQTRLAITSGGAQRPVPFFSPQKVKPPVALDNKEIKKKQLEINVGLLLGNPSKRVDTSPSSSSSQASSSSTAASASTSKSPSDGRAKTSVRAAVQINEGGVDIDSLFARMLGFTEDLVVELPLGKGGKDGTPASRKSEGGMTGSAGEDDSGKSTKGRRNSKKTTASKTAGGTNIARRKKSRSSLTSGPAGLFEQIASASSTITAEAV
ncbi:hypothetical protein GGF37_002096, partial [Kickxella alabastrina]